MRSMVTVVVLAFAACLTAAPAAAQLAGRYELVQVNGHAVPAPSPEEPDVVVRTMSLVLAPEGRFALKATASLDGGAEESEQSAVGGWTVDADALRLTSDDEADGEELRFRWTMEGATLKLYTENGHEFTFRRTQAAARYGDPAGSAPRSSL